MPQPHWPLVLCIWLLLDTSRLCKCSCFFSRLWALFLPLPHIHLASCNSFLRLSDPAWAPLHMQVGIPFLFPLLHLVCASIPVPITWYSLCLLIYLVNQTEKFLTTGSISYLSWSSKNQAYWLAFHKCLLTENRIKSWAWQLIKDWAKQEYSLL